MDNLRTLAIIFLICFVAFLVYVGVWAARKNKQGESSIDKEYFLGGKTVPMFVLAMSYAASCVSAGSFIGDPGIMSTIGWPYYWIATATVACTAIPGLVIIRRMRLQSEKFRCNTISDYCSERYKSPGLKIYLSVLMVICFTFTLIAQFKGAALLLEMYTGVPFKVGLVIVLCVVIFFVSSGGLRSVAWTDMFMGSFMVVMSLMLIITLVSYVGGFGAMEAYFDETAPSFNQLWEHGGEDEVTISAFGVVMCFVYGTFIIFCQPYITARYIALPNIKKKSIGTFLIIAMLTAALFNLMFMCGMAGRMAFPDAAADYMTVTASVNLFPPILACIVMIGFFSAIVSTATSILLVVSQGVGGDIYGKMFKNATPAKQVKVTRISAVVIGLIVLMFNMIEPPELLQIFNYLGITGVGASMCMPLFCGVLWKKSRKSGAWASAIAGPVTYLVWTEVLGYSWGSGMGVAAIGAAVAMFACSWIGNAIKGPDEELIKWADPYIDPEY